MKAMWVEARYGGNVSRDTVALEDVGPCLAQVWASYLHSEAFKMGGDLLLTLRVKEVES